MLSLDQKIARQMKEEIEDSIFNDDNQFIDTLVDLETDEDIINRHTTGGKKDE